MNGILSVTYECRQNLRGRQETKGAAGDEQGLPGVELFTRNGMRQSSPVRTYANKSHGFLLHRMPNGLDVFILFQPFDQVHHFFGFVLGEISR